MVGRKYAVETEWNMTIIQPLFNSKVPPGKIETITFWHQLNQHHQRILCLGQQDELYETYHAKELPPHQHTCYITLQD